MASNWSLCGVCDNSRVKKISVVWCSKCDEGLCKDCREHHSISKGTKKHKTISIDEYKSPIELLQISEVCKIHNEIYKHFCSKHDCPYCKKCAQSHKHCKGLTNINEIIKNVKTSNAFYEIEQTLLEVIQNIKGLSANREENLKSLENKKKEIEEEIKKIRTNVNHYLDKLQNNLMIELTTVEQKESSKIENMLTSLKKREKEITELQENIASIKQNPSELQTFLTMKNIEKDIAVKEKFIQYLRTSDTTNQVSVSCQINKCLQQITASVQTFGEILVCSDPCDFIVQTRKATQAQIMVSLTTRNIDNLTLTLENHISTKLTGVHGGSLLPAGRMVLSSYEKSKIRGFKFDGTIDFEIKEIAQPFDVVFIGDDSIAVTSGSSNEINIINIKDKKLSKTIKVYSENYGVAYTDGNLIYSTPTKGLKLLSLCDESVNNCINAKLSTLAYVTTFRDKLFYTNNVDHCVTCCDYHGNILWTFCDTNILIRPYGISVDNDGNVFVVGCITYNVVVISPDGQRCRQLLSRNDGLNLPKVLHYDTSTNKLLVANRDNEAFVFDVK